MDIALCVVRREGLAMSCVFEPYAPSGGGAIGRPMIGSVFDDLQTVAVGIASQESFGKTEINVGKGGDARRNEAAAAAIQLSECLFGIGSSDGCLPMPDIIGTRVFWR